LAVNFYARLDEMDDGFPRADTPTDTINERLTCDGKILVSK